MSEMSAAEAAIVARFDAGEPAPESWRGDDGLREAIRAERKAADLHGYFGDSETRARYDAAQAATDAEVAALRAKAAAADRVRELHDRIALVDSWCVECGDHWPCPTIRALDGPSPC